MRLLNPHLREVFHVLPKLAEIAEYTRVSVSGFPETVKRQQILGTRRYRTRVYVRLPNPYLREVFHVVPKLAEIAKYTRVSAPGAPSPPLPSLLTLQDFHEKWRVAPFGPHAMFF